MGRGDYVDTVLVPCSVCGEETDMKLYGNESEHQRKYRAGKALCRECWKEAKVREAAEYALEKGFAALMGTAKQVSWAEGIRKRHIDKLAKSLKADKLEEYTPRVEAYLGQKKEARFWIDNRKYMAIVAIVWEKIAECEQEKERVAS